MRLSLLSLALVLVVLAPLRADAQAKLLLAQVASAPSQAEVVAITNPGTTGVDLSDYYLADYDAYWDVVESVAPLNTADFVVRFPAGATIAPGETQTVSIGGAECYRSACGSVGSFPGYGALPTYEVTPTMAAFASASVPDMVAPFAGAVGSTHGLTNGGEPVVLFYWDGASHLVVDVDYVYYGTASSGNPAVNKTGVSVLGSTYAPDTADSDTRHAVLPTGAAIVTAVCRADASEGAMTLTGSNGIGGRDETSEPCNATWTACAPATFADAGVPLDAGGVIDAGGAVDAGSVVDAGSARDGGAVIDAGTPGDASSPTDAGTVSDAGSHGDAATTDGGRAADGSATVDLGHGTGTRRPTGCCNTAGTSADARGPALVAVVALLAVARRRRPAR